MTAIALGQVADGKALTSDKGCAIMEGEAESPELENHIQVWRHAVTYQSLLLRRKIEERLKENAPIDDIWVDAGTGAAEEPTPETAQDRAQRELEPLGTSRSTR